MKVELQCGDTITIPKGCKAVIKYGCVVFEKEEQEFKDGDILTHIDYKNYPCPFIYKGTDERGFYLFYVGIDCKNEIFLPNEEYDTWGNDKLRYATEEEKQLLLAKMKEHGLRWNAKEKRVEKINWRAEDGNEYFRLGGYGNLLIHYEDFDSDDEHLYEFGNYFRTKEQAKQAAEDVRETLRKFHEKIGE